MKLELEYDLIYKAMISAFSNKKLSEDSLDNLIGKNNIVDTSKNIAIDEKLVIDTLKSIAF